MSGEPRLTKAHDRSYVLNDLGVDALALGRLRQAVDFYLRSIPNQLRRRYWGGASGGYQNLADVYMHLGQLADAAKAADKALTMVKDGKTIKEQKSKITGMPGERPFCKVIMEAARSTFEEAETVHREYKPDLRYMDDLWGSWYAEYLVPHRRTDISPARYRTPVLKLCISDHQPVMGSVWRRIGRDIALLSGQFEDAEQSYRRCVEGSPRGYLSVLRLSKLCGPEVGA